MKTKNLIITAFIIFLPTTLIISSKTQLDNKGVKLTELKSDKSDSSNIETSFIEVEDYPSFPGGEMKLLDFINTNINKKIVGNSKLSLGKVVATFHIDTVGRLSNFRIIRSYNQTVDSEFIRVLKLMPNWKSGRKLINGTKGPWVKSSFEWSIPLKIPYKQ